MGNSVKIDGLEWDKELDKSCALERTFAEAGKEDKILMRVMLDRLKIQDK